MKIGKYEFKNIKIAESKIKSLGVETDEDGNEYPTHNHNVVKLGNIIIEHGVYNGEETVKEPVFSRKYHIDVMWAFDDQTDEKGNIVKAEHPYGWKSAAVTVQGQGVHSFYGVDYQIYKM